MTTPTENKPSGLRRLEAEPRNPDYKDLMQLWLSDARMDNIDLKRKNEALARELCASRRACEELFSKHYEVEKELRELRLNSLLWPTSRPDVY